MTTDNDANSHSEASATTDPSRRDITAPTFEQLLDYFEGRAAADLTDVVQRWIAAHPDDTRPEWIRSFLTMAHGAILVDPPQRLSVTLRNQFDAWFAERFDEELEFFVASLEFDSATTGASAGTRGASALAGARQLVFSASPVEVVFHIYDAPQTAGAEARIEGEVLGLDDGAVCTVDLFRAGNRIDSVPCDDFGEFSFGVAEPALYSLRLIIGRKVIDIGPFEIGDP